MPRLRMLHCGFLLAGCSSALLGAGCAGTSPGLSDAIEGSFIRAAQTWDLNHDGKVTCEEWRTYAASLFKEGDSDHNGKLTREEFAKLRKIDRLFEVANFEYYDVNKQDYVTQSDFVDRPNPAFAALPHDKSCVIIVHVLEPKIAKYQDTYVPNPSSEETCVEACPARCSTYGKCPPCERLCRPSPAISPEMRAR